jgi:hypothetical protein
VATTLSRLAMAQPPSGGEGFALVPRRRRRAVVGAIDEVGVAAAVSEELHCHAPLISLRSRIPCGEEN